MVDRKRNITRIAYTMFFIWPIMMTTGIIGIMLFTLWEIKLPSEPTPSMGISLGRLGNILLLPLVPFLYSLFDLIGIICAVKSISTRRDKSLTILVGLGLVALLPGVSTIVYFVYMASSLSLFIGFQTELLVFTFLLMPGLMIVDGLVTLVLSVTWFLTNRRRLKAESVNSTSN